MAKIDKNNKVTTKKANSAEVKPAVIEAQKTSGSEDDASSTSSSEESSSESDSDEEENNNTSPPAKIAPAKENRKRKADNEAASASSSEESSRESDSDEEESNNTSPPAKENKKRKADNEATSTSVSEESSCESDSDEEESNDTSPPAKENKKRKADNEAAITPSSEESSSESDSDEEKNDNTSSSVKITPAEANKKRKADNETAVASKKTKLTNGSASVVPSNEETRSIFVGKLSWNVDNDWLAQEFTECGEVESAYVQMDRNTGRSRGFGYVHFKTAEAVKKALAFNGKEIDGRPVNVDKSTRPDKKVSAEKRAQAFGDTPSPPSAVLFVGNLSFSVNEDALWETFGEHGDIKNVRVPTDRETGKPKGFAYVEFSEAGAAGKAHEALQGFELAGRPIRLDFSQPRDSAGSARGGQRGRGGRGRGFGGDRGRGAGWGSRGGDRGGRGRGRGARTGGITHFEGQKITF